MNENIFILENISILEIEQFSEKQRLSSLLFYFIFILFISFENYCTILIQKYQNTHSMGWEQTCKLHVR